MSVEMKDKPVTGRGEVRCPGAEHAGHHRGGQSRGAGLGALGVLSVSRRRGHLDRPLYRSGLREGRFERLWTRTWQFACREEHIPDVGDYHVYDIGPYSFIMTRVAEDDIRAYYNACLHRGTKLRASGTEGSASEFKCSFHGWSWNIDGSNKESRLPVGFPACRCRRTVAAAGEGRTAGRLRVHQYGSGRAIARRISRPRGAGAYRGLEARRPLRPLPCVKRIAGNWKLNDRGLPGGLSRHPDASAGRGCRTPTPIRNTISMAST